MSAKRKSQLQAVKEREDECFYCGDGGQIISCKKPGCPKVYHADCLNLSKRPAGENRDLLLLCVCVCVQCLRHKMFDLCGVMLASKILFDFV